MTPIIRELGLTKYEDTWRSMQAFVNTRTPQTPDEFWWVEHYPVFTQGQAGKAEHVISAGQIPVVQSDRGGQVTYHGPGQLILYCLLDLKRKNLNIKTLITALEHAVLNLLADNGINGVQRPGAPGIYINEAKIAFIGLRIRRGYSYHGMSLNVNMDLEPFNRIHPCGYPNLKITQLQAFNTNVSQKEIMPKLMSYVAQYLGYTLP